MVDMVLIAARSRERGAVVARDHRWRDGHWRMLTYESHRAFPDADMFVDSTWSSGENASTLEALMARRFTIASGRGGSRLGPDSRSVIARTGT